MLAHFGGGNFPSSDTMKNDSLMNGLKELGAI
jgi:hypothetical protein